MAEEIREGDWISFRDSGGFENRGKVVGVDDEAYRVRLADLSGKSLINTATATVAKGDRVKKIAPPEEE